MGQDLVIQIMAERLIIDQLFDLIHLNCPDQNEFAVISIVTMLEHTGDRAWRLIATRLDCTVYG